MIRLSDTVCCGFERALISIAHSFDGRLFDYFLCFGIPFSSCKPLIGSLEVLLITDSNHNTVNAAASVKLLVNGVQNKLFNLAMEVIKLSLNAASVKMLL